MRRRLVALVLAPLVGLVGFGGVIVRDARATASRARAVESDVVPARELMTVLYGVEQEYGAVQLQLRAVSLGMSLRQLAGLIGSPVALSATARAATDAAVAKARPLLPRGFEPALAALRAEFDGGHADAADLGERYLALGESVQPSLDAWLAHLERRVAGLNGGRGVAEAMEGLDAVARLLRYGTAQLDDLSRLVFASPGERLALVAALGRDSSLYNDAAARLVALHLGSVSRALEAVNADPSVKALAKLLDDVQAGRSLPAAGSLMTMPGAPLRGVTRFEVVAFELVGRTSAMLARDARDLRVASDSRDRLAAVILALAALLSVALVLWIAHSITRPLRRLSENAHAVSQGRLDLEPIAASGPHEIRNVANAFDDLAANLRLLEAKSQALAASEFDNPVLGELLPGRLGESIQTSTHLLTRSIEERDQLQQRLAYQATHDPLTGMQNRAAAVSVLDSALARARRTGEPLAVLFVDLDGFKRINDAHGHDVGDQVLQAVGEQMGRVVRDSDVVARLGGDEFVVIAERTGAVEATTLARRILDRIAEPMEVATHRLAVGVSVGIALSLDGEGHAPDFLARADLALYRAKDRGRARVELYDDSLQQELLRRLEIEQALAATLSRDGDELELHYQPVIDTVTGTMNGVEALVRWRRPGAGLVFPDDFIPIAETTNLIIELDQWVLDTAARQAVAWGVTPGLESLTVAVNVSGRHLLSELLGANVRSVLETTGLDPARLVVEVTETVLLTDIPIAARQLEAIRGLGVRVAIDDFGTGYSSLGALQGLPIDSIKVDRSFVSQIGDTRERSLVAMITRLGHQLGVTIVAEGVETSEQRSALTALGCDEMQGYLICRPVPAHDIQGRYGLVPHTAER